MLYFSNLLNLYYTRNACFLFSVSLNYKKRWR
nr:MAG TPA: Toll-like receptor 3 domain, dimer, IMMUNE SYSTEM [Caudoviricetes sp.]DAM32119.1 MAG TPA: Toll-like receptor 3 domain, dimer, IMMUNE SYSTEM [Caudoviricetes sp.]DAN24347.1 MAG TPA: Toll-like receptor 3 domain, dimer, IMMUNE SYSTEM [Caudoviricetes sp.]DAR31440.1 MAG TPA: Toll-like receptor 3 domain, dimer, IMMUNE SYSTEM [Caudoviricetes sp.]DAX88673.1 MAG TPA: Toll-like receptor 3 domain, dimer, IMMUNE SYSTEM [Caudoviricetes sp.]